MKVVVATGNEGKAREIREIWQDIDARVVTTKEAGLFVEAEENGSTFLENAMIKAKAVAKEAAKSMEWKDAIVIADDSGLAVDALGGEPGVYSARYLGADASYRKKIADLVRRLEGVPDEERSARFVCAIAAVCPDGKVVTAEGVMEGRIGYEEKGENGFGYDPIFYLPEYRCTSAQLSPEEKNRISHRGRALCAMRERLTENF